MSDFQNLKSSIEKTSKDVINRTDSSIDLIKAALKSSKACTDLDGKQIENLSRFLSTTSLESIKMFLASPSIHELAQRMLPELEKEKVLQRIGEIKQLNTKGTASLEASSSWLPPIEIVMVGSCLIGIGLAVVILFTR